MTQDLYRVPNAEEFAAMIAVFKAGASSVYMWFHCPEQGKEGFAKGAGNFNPDEQGWEEISKIWSYLEEGFDRNRLLITERRLFKGQLGVSYSRSGPWGYLFGWRRGQNCAKDEPYIDLDQELIEAATEAERLLWEANFLPKYDPKKYRRK